MQKIGGNRAATEYYHRHLLPAVVSEACPRIVNVRLSLRDFLVDAFQYPKIYAEEKSEEWSGLVLKRVDLQLVLWDMLGIPRPVAGMISLVSDQPVLATWKHEKFTELTGLNALPASFVGILKWLEGLDSRQFLAACVCLLKAMQADPIYVTEKSGDEGVDCIGIVEVGPLRSVYLLVQAKTSQSELSRNDVLSEFGKYMALPHSEAYQRYRTALGLENREDGAAEIYQIVSNTTFHAEARKVARRLGIILRSKFQLAWLLSQSSNLEKLEECRAALQGHLKADLAFNVGQLVSL